LPAVTPESATDFFGLKSAMWELLLIFRCDIDRALFQMRGN
jgi:hypothetical protein